MHRLKGLGLVPLLALMVVCFWQCASAPKPQKGYYASGKLRFAIERDKDGRKVGIEQWWHENGQLKYQAQFVDGFRQGRYAAFYPDGKPWYQGFEIMGRPESTLTYWHPSGHIRSVAFFRQGIQLSREDYDEQGNSLTSRPPLESTDPEAEARRAESDKAAKAREQALAAWGRRVRATVEAQWAVPKALADKGPLKAVASVKVSRHGDVEEVRWVSKSPVSSFNTLAANTFKKVKRLPPFPREITDKSLEIEYAFVTGGTGSAKARLKSGQTYGGGDESPEASEP